MQLTMEILVSIFLMIGTFFMLVGGIGMVRLPDLFMRLHAPTKSSTLGLGSFLIAAMIYSAFQGRFGFAELLLTLFAFLTAPVSANLMAQAALHLRFARSVVTFQKHSTVHCLGNVPAAELLAISMKTLNIVFKCLWCKGNKINTF